MLAKRRAAALLFFMNTTMTALSRNNWLGKIKENVLLMSTFPLKL